MQRNEDPESDSAPEVVPPIRHTVPWRVVMVQALPAFRLRISFVDGTQGEVEMRAFLNGPGIDGTAFQPLRDPDLFAQATVKLGAVHWPCGADLAPDAMYDAIRKSGRWVLTEQARRTVDG